MASSSASENKPETISLSSASETQQDTILSSSSSKKKVTLMTKDGDTFEVTEAVASKMKTIQNMIEDDCANSAIPLPNVEGRILSKVIEYCKKHVEGNATKAAAAKDKEKRKQKELEEWDKEFIANLDIDSLHDILLASNYLDVRSLLDLAAQRAADMMKGKSPEAIRKMFNIQNDISKEEEEQLRKDYQWAHSSSD